MSSLLVVLASALIAAAGFVAWRVGRSRRGSHASCMEDVGATVLFVSSVLCISLVVLGACRLLLVN